MSATIMQVFAAEYASGVVASKREYVYDESRVHRVSDQIWKGLQLR